MKLTKILMGMPVMVEVRDSLCRRENLEEVFDYFKLIDNKFSTYKPDSEISKINAAKLKIKDASQEMQLIFKLAEETKQATNGYFDIYHRGKYDPSGIVKGWAILNAANILKEKGFNNYYVDAGGDVQIAGEWKIGIKNPFKQEEIVKVIYLKSGGVATSGNYIRGAHIYNPKGKMGDEVVSLTVIGRDAYEADRFATAGFAMGGEGIKFIENLVGFEGYMIDNKGVATMTSGFEKYLHV